MHGCLHGVGVAGRITKGLGSHGCRFSPLQQRIDVKREAKCGGQWRLRNRVSVLRCVLSGLSEIAERGTQKEFAALGAARNSILVDESGRLLYTLQRLDWISAVLERAIGKVQPIASILGTRRAGPPANPGGTNSIACALLPQWRVWLKFQIRGYDRQSKP